MVYKIAFSATTSKIFGKTKYEILSFACVGVLYSIFLKSYLVKMKPLDHKIVDVGNFRNENKIS